MRTAGDTRYPSYSVSFSFASRRGPVLSGRSGEAVDGSFIAVCLSECSAVHMAICIWNDFIHSGLVTPLRVPCDYKNDSNPPFHSAIFSDSVPCVLHSVSPDAKSGFSEIRTAVQGRLRRMSLDSGVSHGVVTG